MGGGNDGGTGGRPEEAGGAGHDGGTTAPPEVTEADLDGEPGEDNSTLDEYELVIAMAACGI